MLSVHVAGFLNFKWWLTKVYGCGRYTHFVGKFDTFEQLYLLSSMCVAVGGCEAHKWNCTIEEEVSRRCLVVYSGEAM